MTDLKYYKEKRESSGCRSADSRLQVGHCIVHNGWD